MHQVRQLLERLIPAHVMYVVDCCGSYSTRRWRGHALPLQLLPACGTSHHRNPCLLWTASKPPAEDKLVGLATFLTVRYDFGGQLFSSRVSLLSMPVGAAWCYVVCSGQRLAPKPPPPLLGLLSPQCAELRPLADACLSPPCAGAGQPWQGGTPCRGEGRRACHEACGRGAAGAL